MRKDSMAWLLAFFPCLGFRWGAMRSGSGSGSIPILLFDPDTDTDSDPDGRRKGLGRLSYPTGGSMLPGPSLTVSLPTVREGPGSMEPPVG